MVLRQRGSTNKFSFFVPLSATYTAMRSLQTSQFYANSLQLLQKLMSETSCIKLQSAETLKSRVIDTLPARALIEKYFK